MLCDCRFKTVDQLIKHVCTRSYACSVCDDTFMKLGGLRCHQTVKHGGWISAFDQSTGKTTIEGPVKSPKQALKSRVVPDSTVNNKGDCSGIQIITPIPNLNCRQSNHVGIVTNKPISLPTTPKSNICTNGRKSKGVMKLAKTKRVAFDLSNLGDKHFHQDVGIPKPRGRRKTKETKNVTKDKLDMNVNNNIADDEMPLSNMHTHEKETMDSDDANLPGPISDVPVVEMSIPMLNQLLSSPVFVLPSTCTTAGSQGLSFTNLLTTPPCASIGFEMFALEASDDTGVEVAPDDDAYKCDVCGSVQDSQELLGDHMNIHTGHKPHVCDMCGRSYPTLEKLNNHKVGVNLVMIYHIWSYIYVCVLFPKPCLCP